MKYLFPITLGTASGCAIGTTLLHAFGFHYSWVFALTFASSFVVSAITAVILQGKGDGT